MTAYLVPLILIGGLISAGVYLLLERNLTRMLLGLLLIGRRLHGGRRPLGRAELGLRGGQAALEGVARLFRRRLVGLQRSLGGLGLLQLRGGGDELGPQPVFQALGLGRSRKRQEAGENDKGWGEQGARHGQNFALRSIWPTSMDSGGPETSSALNQRNWMFEPPYRPMVPMRK